MSNVKGSAFAARIVWVRLHQGEAGIERIARQVSPALGALLRGGAVMSRWYPFEQFIEMNVALDRIFGAGDLGLIKPLGRYAADAHLTTIYRLFYKVGTVKWILARASRLWGMHYDSGMMHVDNYPGREAGLRIEGFGTPHRVHCLSVWGWAERSVELSGGAAVRSEELACRLRGDAHCRLMVSWE
ncbi:MAG TPA: hypothetical protein VK698_19540 [Kofleriaceae bacterium]|nr:hypothetical protein [Kofleriaceae bacterium]